MSEKEEKIMETLSKILPDLPEAKQNYLLGYGEAVADLRREQKKKERDEPNE